MDFENGSHEGDERKGAMLEALRLGREAARRGIKALVGNWQIHPSTTV